MITSKKNPRLQLVRALLQDRKNRDESGQFVIEGVRLLEEAAAHESTIHDLFYTQSLSERGRKVVDLLHQKGIPTEEVEESIFHSLMDTTNSQGVAAICHIPAARLPEDLNFIIVADQLRDPGNLGTLLRTAAASGAQAVITTPGSVDLFSPKVVRSAMGAHFHLVCTEMTWIDLKSFVNESSRNFYTYVAAADAEKVCWECDFNQPAILIVGNEADGASQEAYQFAGQRISIPMPGKFESLNAAVAAGILLYEVVRQRSISNH